MLFIGSTAFKQHHNLPGILPKDIDVMGTYEDVSKYVKSLHGDLVAARPFAEGKKYLFVKAGDHKSPETIIEAEIAWEGSLAEEFIKLMDDTAGHTRYATLNGLYTLKMSHRYLRNSPHFLKTMRDIHFMRTLKARIPDELKDFYKRRMAATYDYSHPNLSVTKKTFFDGDGIDYKYDHDSIHETVKIGEHPAYWYFKPDTSEVAVSKDLFEALDYESRINSVLEEAYVLAIERSQVPHPGVLTRRKSFVLALNKVCSSITSGWWREFAWENYDSVYERYDDSYMYRFNAGIDSGLVKPFNEG